MKILVVGNSLDVIPIIENILSQNKEEQVTLFATEGVLPYDRSSLPALVAGIMTETQLTKASESFLADHHPLVVISKKLMIIRSAPITTNPPYSAKFQ